MGENGNSLKDVKCSCNPRPPLDPRLMDKLARILPGEFRVNIERWCEVCRGKLYSQCTSDGIKRVVKPLDVV